MQSYQHNSTRQLVHRAYLIVGAILVTSGVLTGLLRGGQFNTILLRYFTYLSNIALILAFVFLAVYYHHKYRHYVSFGATIAIVVTGLVYNLLLVTINGDPWILSDYTNFVIHFASMIWAICNYLIFEDKGKINIRHMLIGMLFPFVYWMIFIVVGYVSVDRWSPYFFMDTVKYNFFVLILWLLALLVAFVIIGSLVLWYDHSKATKSTDNNV
ncbi:MAG: Pr6Pr family membrane protein [Clostridiales bacterium]|jgi:hypothetical protein|nr:Pr6Pr family membrane protein [Clostridiales bacterium]